MNVLVLDLTHGGDVLALTYRARGEEVTAVDVYGTAEQYLVDHLRNEGIAVVRTTPSKKYDLAVVPVHCPDHYLGRAKYEQKITFHRAVGELAHFSYPTIEVTGTKAKTTACHAISHLLKKKGEKVLLLTSRGLFSVGETVQLLESDASISPATILRLSFMEGEWTRGVFECNLGGTGLADIGVVTTASGDNYPIAAGTRRAVDGIIQMVKSTKGTLVLRHPEINMWKVFIPKSTQVVEFGEFGDINVSFDKGMKFGNKPKCWLNVKKGDFPFTMPATYLAPSYTTAVSAAAGVASAIGLSPKKITDWLTDFEGIPGRGELTRAGEGWLVRDRNPSVTPISIDWNIRVMEEHYANKDLGVVIEQAGPEAKTPLDLETIDKNLSAHSSVKGRYLLEIRSSSVEPPASFEMVSDPNTAIRGHKVTYWCSNTNTD
jgi:hypothetical protein